MQLYSEYDSACVLILHRVRSIFAILLLLRWQRETRIRTVAGRLQGEVTYFAPCGKKLRQYPDVMKVNLQCLAVNEYTCSLHQCSILGYCPQVGNDVICGN